MVFLVYRLKSKDCKIVDRKLARCKRDSIIWKRDPGAIGFTSGFSWDSIYYGGWTNYCQAIDRKAHNYDDI